MDYKYRNKLSYKASGFLMKELCDHLFGSDMHYLIRTARNGTLETLGFYKGEPLHIALEEDYEVRFSSNTGDMLNEDELIKSVTVFYVKHGLYPTFNHRDHDFYISMCLEPCE